MIECPICHVMNEDQAYFCSECGQRFTSAAAPTAAPSGAVGQPPPPPPPPQAWQPSAIAGQPLQDPGGQNFSGQIAGVPTAPSAPNFDVPGYTAQPPQGLAEPGLQPFAPTPSETGTQPAYPTGNQPLFQPPPAPGMQFNLHPYGPPETPAAPALTPYITPVTPANMEPTNPANSADDQQRPRRPRLHSPMLGGSDDDEPIVEQQPAQQHSRGGLRSPLLRGEDAPDESIFPHRNKSRGGGDQHDDEPPPQSTTKGRGGLRSPLLGGGDDDQDSAPKQRASGKNMRSGPLRSPLLGAEDSDRTAFPHRRRREDSGEEEDTDAPQSPTGGRGLRSPLLGGSDEEASHFPHRRTTDSGLPSIPTSGHRKLHSPVLDGTGDYYYEDEYQPIEEYDEDDPTILRSPLLAARQKLPVEKPQAPPAPTMPGPGAAQQTAANAINGAPASAASNAFHSPLMAAAAPLAQAPPPQPVASGRQTAGRGRGVSEAPAEEHASRVPLSIYDSGLRDTIPGAARVRTGPSMPLLMPALIALVLKAWYLLDVMRIPEIIAKNPSFVANEVGQGILIIGVLIFSLTADRK